MAAPEFRIVAIELYERPVTLRIPFRFGAATVTHASQAFVRARIVLGDGREARGAAAELMLPKWFDKSPQKSNTDNIDDLRRSLSFAAAAYATETRPLTAFGHFTAHYAPLIGHGAGAGLHPLTANYGPALIDRAILDALCRALGASISAAIRVNLPGIDTSLTPDLAGFAIDRFVAGLKSPSTIAARHTIGMLDPIVAADPAIRVGDGLPETLEEVIATYGNRYFKLKLGGDPQADVERLLGIAAVLDRLPRYVVTLDGNEQYAGPAEIAELWRKVEATPALSRLFAATLYLEQPLPRAIALDADISELAQSKPLLIDESDATLDAFPTARAAGYTGVSSKSCKGIYKSLLNAARCAHWNADAAPRYFLSGEDLTMQAGLGVQQDLALAALLGLRHVERNGHHYVDGFRGENASDVEQRAFLSAHPGLYQESYGGVRLAIRDGLIDISSLGAPGFASTAQPDWATLEPLGVALATAT
ncbi:MAG: mandelate racemase [Pseudomonadota bacterium]|nr:mandelate racemase [Pseudomonadota bacterium]